jgi:hypothetical protein
VRSFLKESLGIADNSILSFFWLKLNGGANVALDKIFIKVLEGWYLVVISVYELVIISLFLIHSRIGLALLQIRITSFCQLMRCKMINFSYFNFLGCRFYTECLGMKLLRKRDIPEEKYTNAFLGYGPEDSNFVVELTYSKSTIICNPSCTCKCHLIHGIIAYKTLLVK